MFEVRSVLRPTASALTRVRTMREASTQAEDLALRAGNAEITKKFSEHGQLMELFGAEGQLLYKVTFVDGLSQYKTKGLGLMGRPSASGWHAVKAEEFFDVPEDLAAKTRKRWTGKHSGPYLVAYVNQIDGALGWLDIRQEYLVAVSSPAAGDVLLRILESVAVEPPSNASLVIAGRLDPTCDRIRLLKKRLV